MNEVLNFLSSIWNLFEQVNVPLLNISFAQLWLGAFVIALSISILRPLLGIGVGAVNNISKGLNHTVAKRRARRIAHDEKSD